MISDEYNNRANNYVAVLAAISFGLYPNILFQVPENSPDRQPPSQSGGLLCLSSRESAGIIRPHIHRSAYWSSEMYNKPLHRNSIFAYHLLSRVNNSGGGGKSNLRVWDLTRISTLFLVFLTASAESSSLDDSTLAGAAAGTSSTDDDLFHIDFRGYRIRLGGGSGGGGGGGLYVSCAPRTGVALRSFRNRVHRVLQLGISGHVLNRKQSGIVEEFLAMLKEDMER
jgi:hypothetical protein